MRLGRPASVVLAILVAATTSGVREIDASTSTPAESPPPPPGCLFTDRIAGLVDGKKPYFPDVARMPNGKLLVAFRVGQDHNSIGAVYVVEGTCNALTRTWNWGTPKNTISAAGWDFRDPSLTVLGDGMVLLSYFSRQMNTSPPLRRIEFKVSTNSGQNWSQGYPVPIASVKNPVTSAKILERSNGRLVLPLYGPRLSATTDHPRDVAMAETTWTPNTTRPADPGTWEWRDAVIASSAGNESFEEPAVEELQPGYLRAVMRVSSSNPPHDSLPSYEADSTPNTWGSLRALGIKMHAPELLRIPGTNKLLYAWSEPSASGRDVWVRVTYIGKKFSDTCSSKMYDTTSGDAGYSSTVAFDSHNLFTVFYDAGIGEIRGRVSTMADWESHPHYGCTYVGSTCVPPPPPQTPVPPCD